MSPMMVCLNIAVHAIMADGTWGDRGTIISENQLPLTWSVTKKLFLGYFSGLKLLLEGGKICVFDGSR